VTRSVCAAAALAIVWSAAPAHAQNFTVQDTIIEMQHLGPWAQCVIRQEDPSLKPDARGALGERGIAQYKPGGELDRFLAEGHTLADADNPYIEGDDLELQLLKGRTEPWIADADCFR